MSEKIESPPDRRPGTAKDEREARLAAQLRANLRRRKDQSRGRDGASGEPNDDPRRAEG